MKYSVHNFCAVGKDVSYRDPLCTTFVTYLNFVTMLWNKRIKKITKLYDTNEKTNVYGDETFLEHFNETISLMK